MIGLVRQAVRFGAVGLVNTAIGLGLIWLAMWLGVPALSANAIGFSVGVLVSFVLNRAWTFRDGAAGALRPPARETAPRFLAVFAIAWTLNIAVVWLALRETTISPYYVQLFGMVAYSTVCFLLCRIWVFAGTAAAPGARHSTPLQS
ncbi:MAG: GtrA family protein [Pseudomonadota bacterium]